MVVVKWALGWATTTTMVMMTTMVMTMLVVPMVMVMVMVMRRTMLTKSLMTMTSQGVGSSELEWGAVGRRGKEWGGVEWSGWTRVGKGCGLVECVSVGGGRAGGGVAWGWHVMGVARHGGGWQRRSSVIVLTPLLVQLRMSSYEYQRINGYAHRFGCQRQRWWYRCRRTRSCSRWLVATSCAVAMVKLALVVVILIVVIDSTTNRLVPFRLLLHRCRRRPHHPRRRRSRLGLSRGFRP